MDTKVLKENIEEISKEVHNAWMKEKTIQGFHSPNECKSSNHTSFINSCDEGHNRFHDVGFTSKFYKWCDKCHTDLYPYEELPENIKEYDRVTVRAVISAIEKLESKEELFKLEKEFTKCGYNQETIDEIKGTGDIADQIDNLYGEQEAWTE